MADLDMLGVLRALVDAHAQPDPSTRGREPIFYFRHSGGGSLQHHALPDPPPEIDEALLEEMSSADLLDLEYIQQGWKIAPTPYGRAVIADKDRVENAEPVADVRPLVEAVSAQAQSDNKLGWPAVRPVLAAIRDYWEGGGFSRHGVQLGALINALPEEHQGLFAATARALIAGGYLEKTTELSVFELPAEVAVTERAHTVLDGWPGASPDELVENLLAVLATAAASEEDPARKRRLEKFAETVREIGTSTAGEVLARVLMGGGG